MNEGEESTTLDDGRITFGVDHEVEAVQRDPVCGMEVVPATAAATEAYRGVDYYFCSRICKDKFDAAPSQYVG